MLTVRRLLCKYAASCESRVDLPKKALLVLPHANVPISYGQRIDGIGRRDALEQTLKLGVEHRRAPDQLRRPSLLPGAGPGSCPRMARRSP